MVLDFVFHENTWSLKTLDKIANFADFIQVLMDIKYSLTFIILLQYGLKTGQTDLTSLSERVFNPSFPSLVTFMLVSH